MGIIDTFKNLVGIEEYDEDEEEIFVEDKKAPEMTKLTPASERFEPRTFPKPVETPAAAPTTNTARYTNQLKMVVIEPTDFNDCPKLVDSLKAKKPVIINLENLETDIARKIFDFLSGATYALNGNVQKIANNIFVFAPENVDVTNTQSQKNAGPSYRSAWK